TAIHHVTPVHLEGIAAVAPAHARDDHDRSPLLWAFESRGKDPGPERTSLLLQAEAIAARNAWLWAGAEEISRALESINVPYRFVKGIALLPHLPHPGSRWLDDIDLLVEPPYRHQVIGLFCRLGFRPASRSLYSGRPLNPWTDGHGFLFEGPFEVPLEVHFIRRPLPPPSSEDPRFPSVEALAQGLAEHVLGIERLSPLKVIRFVLDLHLLSRGEGRSRLWRASSTCPALRLGMELLDALENGGPLPPPPPAWRTELTILVRGLKHHWKSHTLFEALFPPRSFLEREDPAFRGRPLLLLHARRWGKRFLGFFEH
ncbi:MAG: nucleotidyltransferase family protein, partial [Deltaproteobacteria bacterium]|nr:nucleotidyltransferase family protein [Deltaproteobacteria bacterium]